jgi:hypothetical protein
MLHTLAVEIGLLLGQEAPHSCVDTDLKVVEDFNSMFSWSGIGLPISYNYPLIPHSPYRFQLQTIGEIAT